MMKFLSRSIGVVCLGAGILLTAGTSAALIALQLAGDDFAFDEVRCWTGLSSSCLGQQIDELRHENDALRRSLAELEAQLDEVTSDRDHLETVLSGGMMFSEGPEVAGLTVIVGTIYTDPAGRGDVVRAICFVIQDRNGLDPRLSIANMDRNGVVTALPVDAFDRSTLNVDAHVLETARASCPWPVQ